MLSIVTGWGGVNRSIREVIHCERNLDRRSGFLTAQGKLGTMLLVGENANLSARCQGKICAIHVVYCIS
jgi:hypothetical protein